MSSIRRLSGAANPNFGRAWGNALGGFKNQPRIAGRFATTSQAKAFARIKAGPKVKPSIKVKTSTRLGLKTPTKPRGIKSLAGKIKIPSGNGRKVTAGVTGGVIAAALIANRLNPSVSISRKHLRAGIKPDWKVGPFHAYSSHSIGIERRGDDIIDRISGDVKKKTSKKINQKFGKGSIASQGIHGAIGLSTGIESSSVKIDGSALNRRFRFQGGKSTPPPGAPASAAGGKTAPKPQGNRKGARTVTNTTKGTAGAVRPQRRGGGKKKKKAKK